MSDADLRTHERRFRESGSHEAGLAYLRAAERAGLPLSELLRIRVEVGDLDPERLVFAASANHAQELVLDTRQE